MEFPHCARRSRSPELMIADNTACNLCSFLHFRLFACCAALRPSVQSASTPARPDCRRHLFLFRKRCVLRAHFSALRVLTARVIARKGLNICIRARVCWSRSSARERCPLLFPFLQMAFAVHVFSPGAEPFRVPIAAAAAAGVSTAEDVKQAIRDHKEGVAMGFTLRS